MPVAETFTFGISNDRSLKEIAELDTMVTVVDAAHFFSEVVSTDSLATRDQATGPDENE